MERGKEKAQKMAMQEGSGSNKCFCNETELEQTLIFTFDCEPKVTRLNSKTMTTLVKKQQKNTNRFALISKAVNLL